MHLLFPYRLRIDHHVYVYCLLFKEVHLISFSTQADLVGFYQLLALLRLWSMQGDALVSLALQNCEDLSESLNRIELKMTKIAEGTQGNWVLTAVGIRSFMFWMVLRGLGTSGQPEERPRASLRDGQSLKDFQGR
jgi:hypothetical protein